MQQGPSIYVLDIPVYSPFAHRPSHISPVDDLAFAIAQVRIGVQDKYVAQSIVTKPVGGSGFETTQSKEYALCDVNYESINCKYYNNFNVNIVFKFTNIWCITYSFLPRILKLLSLFAD